MLDLAQHVLKQIMTTLHKEIAHGIPVVGLEPSCIAVFRDELLNLFPHDENAIRLSSQSYLLSEFIEKHADHFKLPQLQRKAVVHGHCHHKAIMKMHDEQTVLSKLGLDYTVLDSGCCGIGMVNDIRSGQALPSDVSTCPPM